MRKGKKIIGQDILSFADGQKVGSVKDLIIGPESDTVVALLVEEGGLLSSARIVPFDNVNSFGKDAVMIDESRSVISADNYPLVFNILNTKDKLIGKKVFTEGGTDEGSIGDVYFDETSGEVLGYEVSGGLIENVQKGTSFLPLDDIVNIGPDLVLITQQAGPMLEAQVGGVQGAVQSAQSKMGQAVGNVAEDSAVGRVAGNDVEDDDGTIVVAAGQRIKESHVEEARRRGLLPSLLASAGMGEAQQAGQNAGGLFESAGDKINATANSAGNTAGGLWEQFKRNIAELTNSAGDRVDEEQTKRRLADIEDAVGRPTTKVILDRQDNVILNLGDIITHESVQRAYDSGTLDSLLASVYKGEVAFSKEEMRVPLEAEATVDKAKGNAPVLDEMQQKVDQAQQKRDAERDSREAAAAQTPPQVPGQMPAQPQTQPVAPPVPQAGVQPQSPASSAGSSTTIRPGNVPAVPVPPAPPNQPRPASAGPSQPNSAGQQGSAQGGTTPDRPMPVQPNYTEPPNKQ
ncbi:MAG: PRC-barrel domain-containing protein [Chloroflexota bacterium]